MCGTQLLQVVESPNGELKAVSYLYDCGATAGFSTQVSILDADVSTESSGNVFVSEGKNNIRLKWNSDTDLEIGNTKELRNYKQEKELNSVSISYK